MKTYSHFGDLGDTVSALCTIAQLGPGELVLYPAGPGRVREEYTPEKVERVRSFFELQPCITSVRFADKPEGLVLDQWRKRYRPQNLADMVCSYFRVPHWPREKPWAVVDRVERVAPVVMHRSPRYHAGFPWKKAVEAYGDRAVFVGGQDEHQEFTKLFGHVPYYATPSLLDLARVIAGASLFVGNQSLPHMVAEALKRPKWLERDKRHDNCHWERSFAQYSHDFPSWPNVPPRRGHAPQLVRHGPPVERPDLTVCVVAWGRPQLLDATLSSVREQLGGLSAWVVVADNQSSDATRAVCDKHRVDYWAITTNQGLNWPIEHLLLPQLASEFVCVADADLFFGHPFRDFVQLLRDCPHITYAKGLDSPEHATAGQLGQWKLKATERGGGVVMRSDTLRAAVPLPNHLINFDWHLCRDRATWAVLPGTVAHLGYDQRTHGTGPTPERYLYRDGRIIEAHA